jgi:hypothetical protein
MPTQAMYEVRVQVISHQIKTLQVIKKNGQPGRPMRKVYYELRTTANGMDTVTTHQRWSQIWAFHKALGKLKLDNGGKYNCKLVGKWSTDEFRETALNARQRQLEEYFTNFSIWAMSTQKQGIVSSSSSSSSSSSRAGHTHSPAT